MANTLRGLLLLFLVGTSVLPILGCGDSPPPAPSNSPPPPAAKNDPGPPTAVQPAKK